MRCSKCKSRELDKEFIKPGGTDDNMEFKKFTCRKCNNAWAEIESDFVKWMGRHIVGLVGTYFQLDSHGNRQQPERIYCFPGIVIQLMEQWFYVTAAHNIEDVFGKYVNDGLIQINDNYALMDYFGPDAKVKEKKPFDYEDASKTILHKRELGLDIALILLRDFFRMTLEGNGVVPLGQEHWQLANNTPFDWYAVLGFPETLRNPIEADKQVGTEISLAFMTVYRMDESPSEIDGPPGDWFIAKVDAPVGLKGMSGGPIFGFRTDAAGNTRYWLVALQSRWFPNEQILYATPISAVMMALNSELRALQSKR